MTIALDTNANYVIVGNYGNDTIALIQWAYEQGLKNVSVVSVDTGWAAPGWDKRVAEAEDYVRKCQFQVVRLISPTPFDKLILQRHSFPTTKFQWCANILKGLPILDWLDLHDPQLNVILLLGHRRESARSKQTLADEIKESEFFGDRHVMYPLIALSTSARDELIAKAGFTVLSHRSLECDPCVNSDKFDLARLSEWSIARVLELEKAVGSTMFEQSKENSNITNLVNQSRAIINKTRPITADVLENMGCGDPYGCGI